MKSTLVNWVKLKESRRDIIVWVNKTKKLYIENEDKEEFKIKIGNRFMILDEFIHIKVDK